MQTQLEHITLQRVTRHLVLMPSYNGGARLAATVREALDCWTPVWVVLDGSDDGSAAPLEAMLREQPGLRLLRLAVNRGKGGAVLAGLQAAAAEGFTHALVMDADGQHPAASIAPFIAASRAAPAAMILGVPQFAADAPRLRVRGRLVSNWWVRLETGRAGIEDSLFGFRVYPIAELRAVMEAGRWMRRFDFDAEAVVRLSWRGVPAINLPAPVRYLRPEEGGVSHFRYGRDNLLLSWMHLRLMLGWLWKMLSG